MNQSVTQPGRWLTCRGGGTLYLEQQGLKRFAGAKV